MKEYDILSVKEHQGNPVFCKSQITGEKRPQYTFKMHETCFASNEKHENDEIKQMNRWFQTNLKKFFVSKCK